MENQNINSQDSKEFTKKSRKEAEESPIMMGPHKMEKSQEEKYLADRIHTDKLVASILSTINKRMGKCIGEIK